MTEMPEPETIADSTTIVEKPVCSLLEPHCTDCLAPGPLNEAGLCALCQVCPATCCNMHPPFCHCIVCGERKPPFDDKGMCFECPVYAKEWAHDDEKSWTDAV